MSDALIEFEKMPSTSSVLAPGGAPASGLMAAFVHHYDDLISHVCRFLGSRGGDKGCAHDVVQEVCVELIETPPGDIIHTPLAFLREVTSRRVIDRYRTEKRCRSGVESVETLPETPDDRAQGFFNSMGPVPVGNKLVNTPNHQASQWVRHDFAAFPGIGVGFGAFYVGERQAELPNTWIIPSYTRYDASAYWEVDAKLDLVLHTKNLTDKTYYDSQSNLLYPGAPLSAMLTAKYRF